MTEFNPVSVTKLASIYFDGQVTSRKITFTDGSTKTLGIMMPGEYTFATVEKEVMEIQQGSVAVLMPDSDTWQNYKAGQAFEVMANSSFKIKVHELADYCCSYLND